MYFASVLPLFHKRSVREVSLHFGTRWDIMRCMRKKGKCVRKEKNPWKSEAVLPKKKSVQNGNKRIV